MKLNGGTHRQTGKYEATVKEEKKRVKKWEEKKNYGKNNVNEEMTEWEA